MIKDCPQCVQFLFNAPYLIESCQSVAADQKRPTIDIINEYMSHYHHLGHPEDSIK